MTWALWFLGGVALLAGPARADLAAERQQLATEMRALDARFERERTECGQRFALNACIDQARNRHRQAQTALKARQRELDEQQRAQKALDRRTAIDRRQQTLPAQQSLQPDASQPAAAASPSTPAAISPAAAAARREARERRAAEAAAAHAKAAERAAAARKLQASIQADQERIKARQAQREAKGKKVLPLPPPPAPPASAPGG